MKPTPKQAVKWATDNFLRCIVDGVTGVFAAADEMIAEAKARGGGFQSWVEATRDVDENDVNDGDEQS